MCMVLLQCLQQRLRLLTHVAMQALRAAAHAAARSQRASASRPRVRLPRRWDCQRGSWRICRALHTMILSAQVACAQSSSILVFTHCEAPLLVFHRCSPLHVKEVDKREREEGVQYMCC